MLPLVVISTAVLVFAEAHAQQTFAITARFRGASCDSPPYYAKVEEIFSCSADECTSLTEAAKTSVVCSSEVDYRADIANLFGDTPYIVSEVFCGQNCSEFRSSEVFQASEKCEQHGDSGNYVRVHLGTNDSASVELFYNDLCTEESLYSSENIILESHHCDLDAQSWDANLSKTRSLAIVSNTTDGTNESDTNISTITSGGARSSSTFGTNDGTSPTLAVDDTATSTTNVDIATDSASLSTDGTSTVSDSSTTASSRSGSSTTATSSSIADGSSEGSTTLISDTTASVATDTSLDSPTTSSSSDGMGSSSKGSTSSTGKYSKRTRSSRITITATAPVLDTSAPDSSATDPAANTVIADASASGSRTPSPVTTAKTSVGTGAVVGIAMGSLAVVILIIGSIVHRRRSEKDDIPSPLPSNVCRRPSGPYWGQTSPINRPLRSQQRYSDQRYSEPRYTDSLSSRHASFQRASSGQSGLWNDDIITAKRIPKDKVHVDQLLSRGAFGEVYMGLYNQKLVAIKMLLPQTRGDIQQVNEFLAEAKLTATMEHPHIVSFIGVAWDSLSDVCVVLEYMDGGDLRSLLSNYEATRHPVGFDREKVTIALHVCHALAYMHSLTRPVIHRDLKSRNVLLNQAMEAKITDFGISRVRLDRTMTAGVGTSLWMAPEVMMGKKYDDKADIFSFGVVLSELDMHTLPYARAMATASANNQMACAIMLQRVAMGSLRVEFSQVGPRSMAELGGACVSVIPSERPTAAETLYKLQTILNRELL